MSHPLLTRVLAPALNDVLGEAQAASFIYATAVVAAIPPDIADWLEQALDVCGYQRALYGIAYGDLYETCGEAARHSLHDRGHPIYDHPYQPLVDLPADASEPRSGVTGPP